MVSGMVLLEVGVVLVCVLQGAESPCAPCDVAPRMQLVLPCMPPHDIHDGIKWDQQLLKWGVNVARVIIGWCSMHSKRIMDATCAAPGTTYAFR